MPLFNRYKTNQSLQVSFLHVSDSHQRCEKDFNDRLGIIKTQRFASPSTMQQEINKAWHYSFFIKPPRLENS